MKHLRNMIKDTYSVVRDQNSYSLGISSYNYVNECSPRMVDGVINHFSKSEMTNTSDIGRQVVEYKAEVAEVNYTFLKPLQRKNNAMISNRS